MLRSLPRIERLDLAVVSLPDWHPEAHHQPTVATYGYVVDHPDGPIVFDTGVGFGNEFIDDQYAPERRPLEESLGAVGIDISAVVAVVNSHLHFDHCGQNPALFGTDIPIFLQQAEIEEVDRDEFYTDRSWAVAPSDQQRRLDGDHDLADGVTILATPGHQSLLIRSDEATVVLAGQAVWALDEFRTETVTASNVFSDDFRTDAVESIRRIKSLRPQVVHFAHCASHLLAPDEPTTE